MRIYEERNAKREISCSYCQNEGHSKRHCPHMKSQWDANANLHGKPRHEIGTQTLKGVDNTMFPQQWRGYYTDRDAKRQFLSHWRYMSERFSPKATAKPKKRKKSKCGFCGSTAHNRRNCKKLKNFVYVLNETNKAYRSEYYDKFIEGMGLGAGALLQTRHPYGYDEDIGVGIITDFPTENIMFTNLMQSWNEYSTRFKVQIVIGGEKTQINLASEAFFEDYGKEQDHGWFNGMYGRWGRISSVVSPAPNRPTKEWFLGQSPCFEWVVKKRNVDTLMGQFNRIIQAFYPHDNLKTKLGAKVYDQWIAR